MYYTTIYITIGDTAASGLHKSWWKYGIVHIARVWIFAGPQSFSESACMWSMFSFSSLFCHFFFQYGNTFSIQKVHVSGAGDFQLGQIDVLKDPCPLSERKSSDVMETEDNGIQVCCVEDLKALEIE